MIHHVLPISMWYSLHTFMITSMSVLEKICLFVAGDTDEEENSSGDEKKSLSKGDRSHLIIWQVFTGS